MGREERGASKNDSHLPSQTPRHIYSNIRKLQVSCIMAFDGWFCGARVLISTDTICSEELKRKEGA